MAQPEPYEPPMIEARDPLVGAMMPPTLVSAPITPP
jgi:hypothetical protein